MYSYFRLIYIIFYPIAAIEQAFKKVVNSLLKEPINYIHVTSHFELVYYQYKLYLPFTPKDH
jgi:hypothetical protein